VQASPLKHVTSDAAPFLIMHGDQDHNVNIENSKRLFAALQKAGVEVTLKILPGAVHADPAFMTAENLQIVTDFFERHLKSMATRPTQTTAARQGRSLSGQ